MKFEMTRIDLNEWIELEFIEEYKDMIEISAFNKYLQLLK